MINLLSGHTRRVLFRRRCRGRFFTFHLYPGLKPRAIDIRPVPGHTVIVALCPKFWVGTRNDAKKTFSDLFVLFERLDFIPVPIRKG